MKKLAAKLSFSVLLFRLKHGMPNPSELLKGAENIRQRYRSLTIDSPLSSHRTLKILLITASLVSVVGLVKIADDYNKRSFEHSVTKIAVQPNAVAPQQASRQHIETKKSSIFPNLSGFQLRWPTPEYRQISSPFGYRIVKGVRSFHKAIDIKVPRGTPVLAIQGGRVLSIRYSHTYGNMIRIDHGENLASLYAHLSKILVRAGETVKAGQKIALSGNTGKSRGYHLHLEILYKGKQIDPMTLLSLRNR